MQFFICSHCKNIIGFVHNAGVPILCCGQKMDELIPGSVDASAEKHVPVIAADGRDITVTVGEVLHPMAAEHFIEWIALETKEGNQRKPLAPGDAPTARFALSEGDEVVAAYAYCNLHGLWKA